MVPLRGRRGTLGRWFAALGRFSPRGRPRSERDSLDLLVETSADLQPLFDRWERASGAERGAGGHRDLNAGALARRAAALRHKHKRASGDPTALGGRILSTAAARLLAADDVAAVLAETGHPERAEEVWRSTDGVRTLLLWAEEAARGLGSGDPEATERFRDSVGCLLERWRDDVAASSSWASRLARELGDARSSLARASGLRAAAPVEPLQPDPSYRQVAGAAWVHALSQERAQGVEAAPATGKSQETVPDATTEVRPSWPAPVRRAPSTSRLSSFGRR